MRRRDFILAALLGAAVLPASVARAQDSLEAAKQAGLVGERPDGLVGFVAATVPANVRALVEQVNAQRLERYREVARTNGVPVDQVQAVAGRQLIERTPSGQYVMNAAGQWQQK